MAAAVQSNIVLAGTPGDDYGSGIRTIWWAHGIGPVKVVFDHVDGSVTTSELQSTNLQLRGANPPDADFFPLRAGLQRHLRVDQQEAPAHAGDRSHLGRRCVQPHRTRDGQERLGTDPGRGRVPVQLAAERPAHHAGQHVRARRFCTSRGWATAATSSIRLT